MGGLGYPVICDQIQQIHTHAHLRYAGQVDNGEVQHVRREDPEVDALGRYSLIMAGNSVRFSYDLLSDLGKVVELLPGKVKEFPADHPSPIHDHSIEPASKGPREKSKPNQINECSVFCRILNRNSIL